ncbi:MAG: shikimate dehydrogenase [Candidatus Tokpelaia sp. JSC161]|jgi:shikimate dehydrogenase|nr:MAG: shikimate dehydrogenase [Candidatus Tokpelaia sp. JSC161]
MIRVPKAFVTGYPVSHSYSPKIHNYWLNFYNIKGEYKAVENTRETFPLFIRSLLKKGYSGGNVTLPHKEQAFVISEKCDEAAQSIGAVNTLWLENGKICGGNTDAYGFICNLDDFTPHWVSDTALVIGAGGASRAILFALKQKRFQRIILCNRTRSRAEHLARYFGKEIVVIDWQSLNDYVGEVDFIVNTTSLGMKNHSKNNNLVNFKKAPCNTIVTDIVYVPLETAFLKQAQEVGLRTVNGLGMLFHQAVPGFQRWFGIQPKVTKELRFYILSIMNERLKK